MTSITKVLTEYCAVYVDDVNLTDLLATDQPLYARRMWQYLQVALPLFSIPAEMPEYLGVTDNGKLVTPEYDSVLYTLDVDQTGTFSISLPEYTGYEIAACRMRNTMQNGEIILTPVSITYDSVTGDIAVNSNEPLSAGTQLDFDFYSDGYFTNTLSSEILTILGKCFQVVWQDRFNTDWLSIVSKVEDKSFFEQNRANKMRADTERIQQLRAELAGLMRRYEQNIYKRAAVPLSNTIKL